MERRDTGRWAGIGMMRRARTEARVVIDGSLTPGR
jgi:hypothetical protein